MLEEGEHGEFIFVFIRTIVYLLLFHFDKLTIFFTSLLPCFTCCWPVLLYIFHIFLFVCSFVALCILRYHVQNNYIACIFAM